MQIRELFAEIPILSSNVPDTLEIAEVWSDSRKVKKGSAFVCLKGMKYDGRVWIPSALENGASVVVCEDVPEDGAPYVQVPDTRSALPLLLAALYHHPERAFGRIIAITGTNGKTTTSFMLKRIFEAAGHKTGLIGTTKYLIGDEEYKTDKSEVFLTTPDPELFFALLDAMRAAKVDTVIMEASSHSLALKKLTGVHFNVGVFSNLTQDHIDFHKTMEEYLAAKKTLFYHSDAGVFNADDPHFGAITAGVPCRVYSYSAEKEADFRALSPDWNEPDGVRYRLKTPDGERDVFVPIPGRFSVYNSLAALSGAVTAGVGIDTAVAALSGMHGVKGRIEKIPLKNAPFSVFIDFAHTPDALENILKTLREFTKGRLITLFGCGGDRDKTKRPVMGRIACALSDLVLVTSDNSRSEEKEDIIRDILAGVPEEAPHEVIVDRTDAIRRALSIAKEGDVILLAGKGHEEYEIDRTGKHPYSERNIVLQIMGEGKQ